MSCIQNEIAQRFPSILSSFASGEEPSDSRLIAELASHVVDAFEMGDLETVGKAFEFAESLITTGSEAEAHAAVVGFLETVQNVASHRKCGATVFEPFLGSSSQQQWAKLNNIWKGKTDLAAVLAAETGASLEPRWWQFWKKCERRTPRQMLNEVENPELRKIIEQITRE